ncbi:CPXV160 protein [Camelpox virus]|nr:CPXV160 protein [Camelpox virus]UEC93478.1 CPXV160 protein [Camelpox virus]UEC93707.1 CPXV160 protein [Camelpox virus]UEC93936.1 CPXV160 protein [Camelpox virus]UEC94164.1 CPXV160 protein [Camelpox virus]
MYVLNISAIVDESYSMNSLIVIGFSFCDLSNSFFIKLYIIITISIVCSNINEYRIIAKFFNSIENRISQTI